MARGIKDVFQRRLATLHWRFAYAVERGQACWQADEARVTPHVELPVGA
jgi:hypothetical protein